MRRIWERTVWTGVPWPAPTISNNHTSLASPVPFCSNQNQNHVIYIWNLYNIKIISVYDKTVACTVNCIEIRSLTWWNGSIIITTQYNNYHFIYSFFHRLVYCIESYLIHIIFCYFYRQEWIVFRNYKHC